MEHLGLVGLPNAGKSSLFNAITGATSTVASHPFSTTETTSGVAQLPDYRLQSLAEMSRSRKVVPAGFEIVDIAGLVAGAGKGEGLGNRFLAGIREVDAIVLVLRAFVDESIVGESDLIGALGVLELELVLADLASVDAQLARRRKAARVDASIAAAASAMEAAHASLESGVPLYRSELSSARRAELAPLFLLTNKPVLVVLNIGEDQLADAGSFEATVSSEIGEGAQALSVCVQLEAEAALLPPAERSELLEGLGLGEGALARVARAAYELIGRRTFFTTGDKESRAWTFRTGAKAPECAGVIHSDLQRGFIRAEVIHWDDLLGIGSWQGAKSRGKLRLEGKEYEVRDGDVLEIRFNV